MNFLKTSAWIGSFAAASLCAEKAVAQTWLTSSIQGGLQIDCYGVGDTAQVRYISYFFNKMATIDEMMGEHNVTFDKIEIDPREKRLTYIAATGVYRDYSTNYLYDMAASEKKTVYWEAEKNDTVKNVALTFIRDTKKICKNKNYPPVPMPYSSENILKMLPGPTDARVNTAALRLKNLWQF